MAAQAARLSLRMQKELKLLIAGPSPGACFPRLSSDSEHLSLSSIQAQIKGPEGTVYEKGVFELNIQIPDRYPFQPPIVTFSTPIYHPNIDTGGRICLDILNLPPKGAWQPSLNISTVLTSIGLLLSEPNPDDGLMCEASREYKYNKQAFDQKARSMTEKYAHPGATRNTGVSRCTQSSSIPSTTEGKPTENESKPEPSQSILGCNNVRGTGRKLTLKSSRPSLELDDDSVNQKETERAHKELKHTAETSNQSRENLNANRRKLSLEAPLSRKRNDDEKENVASLGLLMQTGSDCPGKDLGLSQENISVDDSVNTKRKKMRGTYPNRPFGSFKRIDVTEEKMLANPQLSLFKTNTSTVPDRSCFEPHLQERSTDGIEYVSSGTSRDKLSLGGKKLSLGLKGSSRTKSRENVEPVLKSQSSSMCLSVEVPSGKKRCYGDGKLTKLKASDNNHIQKLASYRNLSEPSKSIPRQHELDSDQDRNETIIGRVGEQEAEESAMAESVIVLDSEDSEEEDKIVSSRSKPVLARKRLGKWKLGA